MGSDLTLPAQLPAHAPLVGELVELTVRDYGERLISFVVFGSVARGDPRPGSDIDILLVVEGAPASYRERLAPILPILRALRKGPAWRDLAATGTPPEPNLIVLSCDDADANRLLYLDMLDDARILVDRHGFFRQRLAKLRAKLDELGARKVATDDGWYWDLKPDAAPGDTVVL